MSTAIASSYGSGSIKVARWSRTVQRAFCLQHEGCEEAELNVIVWALRRLCVDVGYIRRLEDGERRCASGAWHARNTCKPVRIRNIPTKSKMVKGCWMGKELEKLVMSGRPSDGVIYTYSLARARPSGRDVPGSGGSTERATRQRGMHFGLGTLL